MTQIIVALVGNKKVLSGTFPPDSEWSKVLGQRRRVEVKASPTRQGVDLSGEIWVMDRGCRPAIKRLGWPSRSLREGAW
jgi:hypothetical protein